MKKQSFITYVAIAFFSLLLVNCISDDDNTPSVAADSYGSVSELVESLKPTAQTFTLDPTIAQTITGTKGTVIEIGPDTFAGNDGMTLTEPIIASLKEYLSLEDMILGNVQTESNGQLLITGGSYDLTFKDENGDNINVNNWNIQSKIPVETDITGYENDMQYYTGDTTTIDNREVVNWDLGQAEAWMSDGIFNILGAEQGLSNCDALYSMAGENGTQFEVTVPGVSDYSNTTVWLIIEDFPSVVMVYTLNDTEDALTTYNASIPMGLNATLVAITIDEDNYLSFGSLAITVSGDDIFSVPVNYGTTAELVSLVGSLTN